MHSFESPRGRVETFTIESEALRSNLLGDPAERRVHVYLPEDYDEGSKRYPLFLALGGFFESGTEMLSWRAFGESLPQRLDRLRAEERMGGVVCVMPDCFTSLGGNLYVDSPVTGSWEQLILNDLIPEVEKRFRVRRGREHRAVFGESAGGHGALVQGMRHADHWGAVACHQGDMGFEWCYLGELPKALKVLLRHGEDAAAFLDHIATAPGVSREEKRALVVLAAAATFAPDLESSRGIRLPVDPHTCALDVGIWARWLDHDPVRMVRFAEVQENLRRLDGLFIDCGRSAERSLLFGARQLAAALDEAGVPHRYEELEGDEASTKQRLDTSLPFLWEAVSGEDAYAHDESEAEEVSIRHFGDGAKGEEPGEPVAPPGGVKGGCPKCRVEVMRQEIHSGVRIDRCPVCKGVFLDQGELEALFEANIAGGVDALTSTGVSDMLDEVIAWCMRCGGEMGPVKTIAGVLINVCDRCGTVFLDQGELAALDLFRS